MAKSRTVRPTTPTKEEDVSGRYSGTEQQEAAHGGRQHGNPSTKKPGRVGYGAAQGPHGGKVDGDAPRGSNEDDKG